MDELWLGTHVQKLSAIIDTTRPYICIFFRVVDILNTWPSNKERYINLLLIREYNTD